MKRKRAVFILLLLAAALVGAFLYLRRGRADSSLQGSGTVEARDIRVGSKVGGRIEKVLVREGDSVKAGQTLVTFDDRELQAALQQSRAAADKARRGFRPEEIAAARAAAAEAKADFEQRKNGYRQEDIAAAQADLDRARAEENRTHQDFDRYDALSKKAEVSKQQRDAAEASWKIALAQQENAQHKLDQLHKGYRAEEIAAAEARYQQALANFKKFESGNRPEDVALAQAAYSYDQARARESEVRAPADSVVEVLDIRPGDLVAPNTPVATLLEADQIYVRIYIPETEIGRVKLGQVAEVRVDSFPNKIFSGVVEQINNQAEFLPRNVQTREERVHQVVGIKIRIHDSSGGIRAGMAADVKLKANI
ncbi:MAG: efflux RND transporter periplasmic adaptor subunit [Candidatus Acidiferrum sp.]